MVTAEELKTKLEKYIIDEEKYPHVPRTLDGEVMLEEVYLEGILFGVISITLEELAKTINMRDDPTLRPDHVMEAPSKYAGRNVRELTKDEFEDFTGHKKYLERWRREGIEI